MKKILLIIALLLASCSSSYVIYDKNVLTVNTIESCDCTEGSYTYKYLITVYNHGYPTGILLYTNQEYRIGDTLKLK